MATAAVAASAATTSPSKNEVALVNPRVDRRFSISTVLGKGAFASIYKAHDKTTGQDVALKEIRKGNAMVSQPLSEYLLGKMLNHKNVVKTLDCIDTRNYLYIVQELATGGDLFARLDPSGPGIGEEEARRVALQLAEGLVYLHSRKVVHSDIKPENVLIDGSGNARICDLGLAAHHGSTRPGPALGTGAYMAPEIVCVRTKEETYSILKAQDTWSFGVVLYAILVADLPWERALPKDPDYATFLREGRVTARLYPFSLLSSGMLALMSELLAEPDERCDMSVAVDFLQKNTPWFASQEKQRKGKAVPLKSLESDGASSSSARSHATASSSGSLF